MARVGVAFLFIYLFYWLCHQIGCEFWIFSHTLKIILFLEMKILNLIYIKYLGFKNFIKLPPTNIASIESFPTII